MTEQTLSARLLAWFDVHRRAMPWRGTQDPYAILVSEVMLQQTRVDTVLPYYQRFLASFPTANTLAEASLEEVLGSWQGLGYYRRARMLHAAAQAVVKRGGFPETAKELRALPGVGAYTAGALASIAFGEATPAVDGNVERVLTRLRGYDEDPKSGSGRRWMAERALEIMDPNRPGDSNQALMELGALVCTPAKPQCAGCPWSADCVSRGPRVVGRPRPKAPEVFRVSLLVTRGDEVLLARRSTRLFQGLWEPPSVPLPEGGNARTVGFALAASLGLRGVPVECGSVTHILTHRRLVHEVFHGIGRKKVAGEWLVPLADEYDSLRYCSTVRPGVPLSTLARKLVERGLARRVLALKDASD